MRRNKLMISMAMTFALLFNGGAVAAHFGLIQPSEVQKLLQEPNFQERVLILDTRGSYKSYIAGHLPGARHMNFDTLRGTDANGVPVQYLPDDLTRQLLMRAGVHQDKTHIVYAGGGTSDDILSSSMVAYVLQKFGVTNVRILDGGYDDYAALFGSTQVYPKVATGVLPEKMASGLSVDVTTLMARKDHKNVIVVDARPEHEYLGQDNIWPRQGHIPGAINFTWSRVMTKDNTHKFLPVAEVRKHLTAAGITPEKEVIVYCGTSREGTLLQFYLTHLAGYPNVKLYEGSWKEYASLTHLPVATGKSRI